jgi:hypothetical protein
MAIQVRRGSNAVLAALAWSLNTLRQSVADGSAFVHRDTTSTTLGDASTPRAVPAVFSSPAVTDLPSLLRLCAELAARHTYHLADGFAHRQADGTNILANAPPSDLPSAQAFLNEAKAKWNAHLTASGVHVNNDPQPITAPNAVDLQTSMDLANTYRAVYGVHIQNALPGAFLQVIDP